MIQVDLIRIKLPGNERMSSHDEMRSEQVDLIYFQRAS